MTPAAEKGESEMSGSIDAINGNGMSLQFEEFARIAQSSSKKTNVVRFLGSSDAATVHEVSVTKSDKVGKLFRSGGVKTANDTTRAIFRQSVASMFGGEDHIPENVRKAMKLNDYGRIYNRTTKHIVSGTYTFAVEGTEASVAYVAEAGSVTETTPSLTPVTLSAYNLAALVKLSKEVVRDPAVNFLDWVITALGKGFAKKMDAEILSGTGSSNDHITGILTALAAETLTPHIVTDSTALGAFTWANLKAVMSKLGEGTVVTLRLANAVPPDMLDDMKYTV